jgi:DNA anti-recombination protein RmuC
MDAHVAQRRNVMAKDTDDVVMPMLREMRSEIREQFAEIREEFSTINGRLEKLESGQKTIRQALTADTMMSKFVTGDFEERIFELERKVDSLMKAK